METPKYRRRSRSPLGEAGNVRITPDDIATIVLQTTAYADRISKNSAPKKVYTSSELEFDYWSQSRATLATVKLSRFTKSPPFPEAIVECTEAISPALLKCVLKEIGSDGLQVEKPLEATREAAQRIAKMRKRQLQLREEYRKEHREMSKRLLGFLTEPGLFRHLPPNHYDNHSIEEVFWYNNLPIAYVRSADEPTGHYYDGLFDLYTQDAFLVISYFCELEISAEKYQELLDLRFSIEDPKVLIERLAKLGIKDGANFGRILRKHVSLALDDVKSDFWEGSLSKALQNIMCRELLDNDGATSELLNDALILKRQQLQTERRKRALSEVRERQIPFSGAMSRIQITDRRRQFCALIGRCSIEEFEVELVDEAWKEAELEKDVSAVLYWVLERVAKRNLRNARTYRERPSIVAVREVIERPSIKSVSVQKTVLSSTKKSKRNRPPRRPSSRTQHLSNKENEDEEVQGDKTCLLTKTEGSLIQEDSQLAIGIGVNMEEMATVNGLVNVNC